MTAQDQLINFANEIKAKSNTPAKNMPAADLMGQAFVDGVCYYRSGSERKSISIKRTGKTIVVSETHHTETCKVVYGKMTVEPVDTTAEVMRIEL